MRNTNGHLVVPSWSIKLNTEKNKDEIQYRYYATTTSTTKLLYIYIWITLLKAWALIMVVKQEKKA